MTSSGVDLLHSPALQYAYPLYRNMLDNSIVFMYHGPITPDIVVDVLGIVEERLEESGEERRVSKKLFNIMVESFSLTDEGKANESILLVRRLPYLYSVSIGRRIRTASVYEVRSYLDTVNLMTDEQIRLEYYRLLNDYEPNRPILVGGLPAISILDLARKSCGYLHYNFEYLDDYYSFFSLEARIDKMQQKR
jgi:hypothetical protein